MFLALVIHLLSQFHTILKNYFRFDEEMRVGVLISMLGIKLMNTKSFLYIQEALMYHQFLETSQTISDNTRTKKILYMYNLFSKSGFSR